MRAKADNQSGQAALLALVTLMIALGGILWRAAGSFSSSLSTVRNGFTANAVASAVTGRVKRLMTTPNPACSAAVNAAFENFRNYTAPAPRASWNLKTADCLITADEAASLSLASISIEQTTEDAEALWRKLRLDISISTKESGAIVKTASRSKDIRLSTASLGFFGFVFTAIPSAELVDVSGGASAIFHSSLFYAGTSPVSLMSIHALPQDPTKASTLFTRPFFVRASSLLADAETTLDMGRFEKVFPRGIQTNALASPALDAYLPKSTPEWNHKIDYYYQYSNLGFPLPEPPTGASSVVSCDDAVQAFDPARADITSLPAPTKGIPSLTATCGASLDSVPTFVQLRSDSDLTLDMDLVNNVFCGIVAARELTIRLSAPGSYGVFGNFAVQSVKVIGPAGATVHFYNPSDSDVVEVTLPPGQSLANMAAQFKRMSTSTAYNFFLPIAQNAPQLLPRAPASYLSACPAGSAVAGGLTMKSQYDPISKDPTIAGQFAALKSDASRPMYLTEESL